MAAEPKAAKPELKARPAHYTDRFCADLGVKKVEDFRKPYRGRHKFIVSYFDNGNIRRSKEALTWEEYAAKLILPHVAFILEV